MDFNIFIHILIAAIAAGTPFVYAALGELITEKSGVLNLGVEGMMLVGAISGFIAMAKTGSLLMAVLCGMTAGALMAGIFAVLTLTLMANQVASGLALTIFGVGLREMEKIIIQNNRFTSTTPIHFSVINQVTNYLFSNKNNVNPFVNRG